MKALITGMPGVGKSTLLGELVRRSGLRVAGISTPEWKEKGKRAGFRIVDLASGAEEVMAAPGIPGPRVSRYGVDVGAIDRAVERFWNGFDAAEWIALDEIGPMEYFSDRFREMVERVLASGKPVIAVVHRHYEKRFRDRLEPFRLEPDNFRELKMTLLTRLAGLPG